MLGRRIRQIGIVLIVEGQAITLINASRLLVIRIGIKEYGSLSKAGPLPELQAM